MSRFRQQRQVSGRMFPLAVGLLAVTLATGCAGPQKSTPTEPVWPAALSAEQKRLLEGLRQNEYGRTRTLPDSSLAAEKPGQWTSVDGARFCDGYLTRAASDEHCSTVPPDDWLPFEFNGSVYFVQPLTQQRNSHNGPSVTSRQ